MFNWLQRSLQKEKKEKRCNRDDQISLHLDSALNLTEQFTPVRGICRVLLNQTWGVLQPLCTSINDSIRCKGNSRTDNYRASSHALLILITAFCAETQRLPFPEQGQRGCRANSATCQTPGSGCCYCCVLGAGCSLRQPETPLAELQPWKSRLPPAVAGS